MQLDLSSTYSIIWLCCCVRCGVSGLLLLVMLRVVLSAGRSARASIPTSCSVMVSACSFARMRQHVC